MDHTGPTPNVAPSATGAAGNAIPEPTQQRTESCPHCGTRWNGLAPCHCTACHYTFTNYRAFARHRIGYHANPKNPRRCLHPATCGLIRIEHQHRQLWTCPDERPQP